MTKRLGEGLIKLSIEKNYNIKIEKIEKNLQSTDGNVYIVYTKEDKYVIKIYNEFQHTKSMIELYKMLKYASVMAPEIIQTKTFSEYIKIEQKYIVMYSFFYGDSIKNKFKNNKIGDATIYLIAKELRKLHKINQNCKNKLLEVPFEVNAVRKSILHFDLTRDNIFITKNNEIGFIDFDDAKFGASICDVAIIIAIFFFSKTKGVNINGVNKFIDSYYENEVELKSKEVPQIKNIALKWIDYILNNNKFDTSTTESFKIKEQLISENLK